VVNLIYGDNGAAGNLKGSLGELLVLLQRVPKAYLRIIRRRIAMTRAEPPAPGENDRKEKR
jgi:hypothetical protein